MIHVCEGQNGIHHKSIAHDQLTADQCPACSKIEKQIEEAEEHTEKHLKTIEALGEETSDLEFIIETLEEKLQGSKRMIQNKRDRIKELEHQVEGMEKKIQALVNGERKDAES